MFCIQCEQTLNNNKIKGCAFAVGMCGKTSAVSVHQDSLVHALQELSAWASKAREFGIIVTQIDHWVPQALFATLTNVNFDPTRILALIKQTKAYTEQIKNQVLQTASELANFLPNTKKSADQDLIGLSMLCLCGLKGVAAYLEHARVLAGEDGNIYAQFHQMMALLASKPNNLNTLLDLSLQIGMFNFKIMQKLETAAISRFGSPTPTHVNTKMVKGKCILVSGHDLSDLELILQQTQGKNINIYTHSEMLPAHGYPQLRKYPHLVAHYGGAWHNQQQEFALFPGAIVMTSNCLLEPKGYAARLFTRNTVGWQGVKHIEDNDFNAVIECALAQNGFQYDEIQHNILVGFGRQALLSMASNVIEQVNAGNIKHFFLIGGCDGEKKSRSYYTNFALNAPENSLLLTLGCAKFRFNQHSFGEINNIPRLLDIGQCNDAYAAIMFALELSKAFKVDINQLPLTLVLSWFEQKAIVILLTLFALGVKGIYIGPSVPAFLTDNLVAIIKERFDLRVISEVEDDLAAML